MKTSEMVVKLRRMSRRKMDILNSQDAKFLGNVAERLEWLEERIAIITEPKVATEEQLAFPPTGGEAL